MRKRLRRIIYPVLLLLLALFLVGCSKAESEPDKDERKEELGKQFITELRDDILPLRNQQERLAQQGVVVSSGKKTENIGLLHTYISEYQAGEETHITAALYSTAPLIVVRVTTFSDGTGYYFRYELEEDKPLSVTGKQIDSVSLKEENDKVILSLQKKKKDTVHFTFFKDSKNESETE